MTKTEPRCNICQDALLCQRVNQLMAAGFSNMFIATELKCNFDAFKNKNLQVTIRRNVERHRKAHFALNRSIAKVFIPTTENILPERLTKSWTELQQEKI